MPKIISLLLLDIVPTSPEIGYGYIKAEKLLWMMK